MLIFGQIKVLKALLLILSPGVKYSTGNLFYNNINYRE